MYRFAAATQSTNRPAGSGSAHSSNFASQAGSILWSTVPSSKGTSGGFGTSLRHDSLTVVGCGARTRQQPLKPAAPIARPRASGKVRFKSLDIVVEVEQLRSGTFFVLGEFSRNRLELRLQPLRPNLGFRPFRAQPTVPNSQRNRDERQDDDADKLKSHTGLTT